jgi:hypothetical protein
MMTKAHGLRWFAAFAAVAAACSDTSGSSTNGSTDDAGGPSGSVDAAFEDAGIARNDADTPSAAVDAASSGADAASGDAGDAASTPVDAGSGGTPTLTIGEISAVPRNPYGGQSVRLSISLSGQATLFWEQTAGPLGRFSSQSGTTVQWTPPGVNTRTAYTVQVRVGTISPVTKTIAFTVDPPTYTQVWTDILQPNCRSCHTFIGNTPAAGYATLVGANHGSTAACTTSGFTKRIVAGNAQQSLVFRKVAGSQPSACGGRMPSAAAALPIGQVESIGAWINLGAPNN